MKRPSTKTLVVGHPVIAVPLTLTSGVCLLAGFQTGNSSAVLIGIALIAAVHNASQQASAYRAWQIEWDAMGDGPERRSVTPAGIFGVAAVAALALLGYAHLPSVAYWAGYSLGWVFGHRWLLAALGIVAIAILVQFMRHGLRRAKPAKPVKVVAKRILSVPTIADAYRALPPYCHALLGGQK